MNQIMMIFFKMYMCPLRCYKYPILYNILYDDAYKSNDRNQWILDEIKKNKCCLRKRIFTLQLIYKAVTTQSIFNKINSETFRYLKEEIEIAKKQRVIRLRVIQKKTLHHMYKPMGRMFWKNYLKCKDDFENF